MMSTIRILALNLGSLLLITLMAWSPSHAQTTFSNASLQGTYSIYNTSGDAASWGVATFDGEGEWTLATTVNVSDGMGGRMNIPLGTLPGTGAYVVNPDGTGVATIEFLPGGADAVRNYDFVISQVDASADGPPFGRAAGHGRDDEDHALATEVSAVIREGGVRGQLVAPTFKRISD